MPVEKAEKFILVNAAIVFGLGVFLSLANHDYFHDVYTAEDGLLEWLTVFALGSVAVLLAGRLWNYRHLLNWRQRAVLAVLVVLATFGAGEEISWGQRLLGIDSSEFFLTHNKQQEINLHNLAVGDFSINKDIFSKGILLLFLVYLALIKPLYHASAYARRFLDNWGIPIPKRYQYLGYLLVIIVVEGLVNLSSGAPRRGELTEFSVTIVAALNLIYPLNRPEETLSKP